MLKLKEIEPKGSLFLLYQTYTVFIIYYNKENIMNLEEILDPFTLADLVNFCNERELSDDWLEDCNDTTVINSEDVPF